MVLLLHSTAKAQLSRLGQDIDFHTQLTAVTSGGDYSPFWFSANRYGLGSPDRHFGYLRVGAGRDVTNDSTRNWRLGYGADIVGAVGTNSHFTLQQLYADVQWRMLRLSLGQKERPMDFKDNALSSGAMTLGINARPLPQVRLEMPDFWTVPGTKGWFAFKAHIAYGFYTDNKWQRDFTIGSTTSSRTANSYFHSKALFLRVGNKERFPLTLSGGLEMAAQFGGEAWNLYKRTDEGGGTISYHKMTGGIKAFWNAFIPGGSDATDGDYANVEGNHLGSWHLRLDYHGKGWGVGAYMDHFFEDHSQMFWQYAWKDMLLGVEVKLPRNPFVSKVVYEHIGTTDQSGAVYHDKTANIPEGIYGRDNYYTHHIYGAWQHAGFVMGNPLLCSPIYNASHQITVIHSRIQAHHIGLSGNPTSLLQWRVLYTHVRSLGTYFKPLPDPQYANALLLEATYHLPKVPGLSFTAAYGHNDGEIYGKSNGAMLTVAYNRLFNKKK